MVRAGMARPDGRLVHESEAMGLVPPDGQTDPYVWLPANGYQAVAFGITAETLCQWEALEPAATIMIGLMLLLGNVAIIDRRRPT
jgi:hypothetical protein